MPNELRPDTLHLAKQGDQSAFAALLAQYTPLIERQLMSARSRRPDILPEDEKDLRQEAYLAFYRALMSFDVSQGEVSFGLYAKICIRNRLISILRSLKSKGKVVHEREGEKAPRLWQASFDREELESLSRQLLSRREREIFLMYADGKSYSDIAQTLGINEKSVDNALFRAKKKLRSYYSEH